MNIPEIEAARDEVNAAREKVKKLRDDTEAAERTLDKAAAKLRKILGLIVFG